MRIAAVYDIHGNLPALEAVLDEIRQENVDQIVVGGDVLPGPMPRETLRTLLRLKPAAKFIRGNGDQAVLARMQGKETPGLPEQARNAIGWVAEQLTPEDRDTLADWPETLRVATAAFGHVLFCHATPRNNTEIFTRLTTEECLLPVFAGVDAPLVICGHTHMQFDRMVGNTRVVNAGSVGMPFGERGAFWLLLNSNVELRRTDYDFEKAAGAVRMTAYPSAEEFAARNILRPPSAAEMLEVFRRAELR